ncbi:hypothetical protein ACFQE7_11575 [Nonomuraea ferruginea]
MNVVYVSEQLEGAACAAPADATTVPAASNAPTAATCSVFVTFFIALLTP